MKTLLIVIVFVFIASLVIRKFSQVRIYADTPFVCTGPEYPNNNLKDTYSMLLFFSSLNCKGNNVKNKLSDTLLLTSNETYHLLTDTLLSKSFAQNKLINCDSLILLSKWLDNLPIVENGKWMSIRNKITDFWNIFIFEQLKNKSESNSLIKYSYTFRYLEQNTKEVNQPKKNNSIVEKTIITVLSWEITYLLIQSFEKFGFCYFQLFFFVIIFSILSVLKTTFITFKRIFKTHKKNKG